VQDAQNFLARKQLPGAKVLLVSRRHVAIIILPESGDSFVTAFQKFVNSLSNSADFARSIEDEFMLWLSSDEQGYFCFRLPEDFYFSME
jgi:hypothetical protein